MSSTDAAKSQQSALSALLAKNGATPLSVEELSTFAAPYQSLLGHVPPRVAARHVLTGALDKPLLALQEQIRDHVLSPPCFDDKTTQLMVFGMLMIELSDAAKTHAIAARRCGASWEELQAVVSLAFLFRGVPAANRGASLLAELALQEGAA